jgi:hypothetical protein
MNCNRVSEITPLYLSGELDGESLFAFQAHLGSCPNCAGNVNADVELDQALRRTMLAPEIDASAVIRRFHAQSESESFWQRWKSRVGFRPVVTAFAVTMVLVLAVGIVIYRQSGRSLAVAIADDHYSDIVLLRHSDWDRTPAQVSAFVQQHFPGRNGLVASITPARAAFEKVRICNVDGRPYAHFVFDAQGTEISVFLVPDGSTRFGSPARYVENAQHDLDVAGFSSSHLMGMVVGQHGAFGTRQFAEQMDKQL